MAIKMKESGVIVGGQFIGRGLVEAVAYVDTAMGKAASPILQKPSTFIKPIAGIGLLFAATKVKAPWDIVAASAGGYLVTELFSILKEYTSTPAPVATRVGFVPQVEQSISVKTPAQQVARSTGRYTY